MGLKEVREKINSLDSNILKLLASRSELATEVAAMKIRVGKPIRDAKREKELIAKLQKEGEKLGIEKKDVDKIWKVLMGISRGNQKSFFLLAEKLSPKKLKYREKKIKTGLDLLGIFARLKQNFDTTFLLESLGEYDDFSRKSYLGFSPHAIIQSEEGRLIVDGKAFPTPNPYEALKLFLPKLPKGPGFRGGLFGYLTYEATRYFEPAVDFGKHPDFPDFEFGLYFDGLIFDKRKKELKYFYLSKDRSKLLEKILRKPLRAERKFKATAKGENRSQKDFEAAVTTGKKEIFAGNTFQFVIGRKYFFDLAGDRLQFYEKLREVNPSPHMFYLQFGKRELIGSSPELIVRVENGRVENYPLAGTRKVTGDAKIDAALAKELLNDKKEKAEHMMLVDLARNDVGKVCEFGSVKVSKMMVIKKFSHVQHIASEVVGKLRKDQTAFDALAAQMPMGTVSGAPKIETMKIIRRLEPDPRGPYAGAVGFFSLTGDCVLAVNLRSLFAANGKATVQAGAGVVADSVPRNEFKEVAKKVRGVITALEEASS
ncbi:chorismate-binding protein [Candidatus Gracilibacteria bacterium]|nr:chorismate-binding protein [Candidatus Gracilibacteria bacterium]MCF7856519.1 chorismate-binding protein [Candidatus Gracilibacteria bacterium]MCF7896585.1 chorismate-binding protein [Candidatus Gracilibacteria bacterium]